MLRDAPPSTTAVFERTENLPHTGQVSSARHAALSAPSAFVLHPAPAAPASVATVNATLATPEFSTAMAAALVRRPARNAHDLGKLARQVLARQFGAVLDGARLTVTWDAAARTNVIRAEADSRG